MKRLPGIDAHQSNARVAADMLVPSPAKPNPTARIVPSILCEPCAACGCTNAWPAEDRQKACAFCSAIRRPARIK